MEIISKKLEDIELNRLVSPRLVGDDAQVENAQGENTLAKLRPQSFDDYPGQDKIKANLQVYVKAAKMRGQALDHVLLHGPPGLGKTTLAHILANEMGVPFYNTSGPSIDKPGDLVGILTSLEENSILFIDEIHRLPIHVEEVLYSAMEDYHVDIIIGQGQTARTMRMPISPFTLVGATTRISLLSRPLINRFGIQERLEFYDQESLTRIVMRSSEVLGVKASRDGAFEIAARSRGTPRIANRLLKRVWDFAQVDGMREITKQLAAAALGRLEIDERGLDRSDRFILQTILDKYEGGPVGIDTLAATVGEERATVEDVFEPHLVHQGLLARGPRGRSLTPAGRKLLNDSL